MDAQKTYEGRMDRVATTLNFQKPDMIPIMGMLETWTAHHNGVSILDIDFSAQGLIDAYSRFARDFDFDAIGAPIGCRWGPIYSSLGSTEFSFYNEKGTPHPGVHHIGRCNMEDSEYPELIKDPLKFIMEKLLPRKFPALRVPEPRRSMVFAKGAIQWFDYFQSAMGPTAFTLASKYGLPIFFSSSTEMPLDVMADYFRGFQGVVMDVRRRKQELIEACEALYPIMLAAAIGNQVSSAYPTVFIPLHIPTYLKPKDFEDVYYPTFKRMLNDIIKVGRRPALFMEGDWAPYAEFFQDLPKGAVVGMFEHGDHKAMKKNYGNTIALVGGMPLQTLNYATKEELTKLTRQLIDDMAPGYGWLFGFDKSWLAPNDANAENLWTVIETVRKYGVYN